MKWFFRGVLIFIGVIILVPVSLVLLSLDSDKPPVEAYRTEESRGFSSKEVMSNSMDNFLADSSTNDFSVELTQDQINTMIYQTLKETNANYLIDDSDDNKYFMKTDGDPQIGIVGAWTKLQDDQITLKVRVDLTKPVKLSTSLSLSFKITFNVDNDPKQMKLKLTQAKIGNLPLPRSLVNTIADKAGFDIKTQLDKFLTKDGVKFGEFDQETWTATIDKIKLVKVMMTGSGQQAMTTLAKVLTYNKLLNVSIDKSKFKLQLDSSKLYLNETLNHVPEHNKLHTAQEKDAMLQSKGTTMLLSSLGGVDGELYVNLSELEINKLLDFYMRDQALQKSFKIGQEDYTFNISIPTIDVYPTGMHLNIQLEFFNQLDSTKKFITTFKIELILTQEQGGLQFILGGLKIGEEVTLNAEETQDLLELFGASEAVNSNMIVINDFLSSFASNKVKPKGQRTNEGYLTLTFEGAAASDNTIIGNVQGAILNALGGVTTTDPTVQGIIDEIAATPQGEVTPEQIQTLMENVDQLSPEEIQSIQDQLVAELGPEEAAALLAQAGGTPTP